MYLFNMSRLLSSRQSSTLTTSSCPFQAAYRAVLGYGDPVRWGCHHFVQLGFSLLSRAHSNHHREGCLAVLIGLSMLTSSRSTTIFTTSSYAFEAAPESTIQPHLSSLHRLMSPSTTIFTTFLSPVQGSQKGGDPLCFSGLSGLTDPGIVSCE